MPLTIQRQNTGRLNKLPSQIFSFYLQNIAIQKIQGFETWLTIWSCGTLFRQGRSFSQQSLFLKSTMKGTQKVKEKLSRAKGGALTCNASTSQATQLNVTVTANHITKDSPLSSKHESFMSVAQGQMLQRYFTVSPPSGTAQISNAKILN